MKNKNNFFESREVAIKTIKNSSGLDDVVTGVVDVVAVVVVVAVVDHVLMIEGKGEGNFSLVTP